MARATPAGRWLRHIVFNWLRPFKDIRRGLEDHHFLPKCLTGLTPQWLDRTKSQSSAEECQPVRRNPWISLLKLVFWAKAKAKLASNVHHTLPFRFQLFFTVTQPPEMDARSLMTALARMLGRLTLRTRYREIHQAIIGGADAPRALWTTSTVIAPRMLCRPSTTTRKLYAE